MKERRLWLYLQKWFDSKGECLLFISLSIVGFVCAFYGASLLDGFPYNFGKNVGGMFVPPIFCLLYITYCSCRGALEKRVLFKTGLLYFLQVIPYTPLFLQTFQPTPGDDFSRYLLYAQHMVNNHTLWGGDKLFFKEAGYHYVTQPGYRYFIYLELLLFKDLFRFVPFINIGLYLLTVYFFQFSIVQKVPGKKLRLCLLLLVLLFSPYVIKNLLMGLPEWLTVTLLMWVSYNYLVSNKSILAVFILGLVPFLRQNLLISVLLLFIWMLVNSKRKASMVPVFLLPLLLPVYHNLYYAGSVRFFVDVFQFSFLTYKEGSQEASQVNYARIFSNLIHYIGLMYWNGKVFVSFIAALFLPFATVLYFHFIKNLRAAKSRLFFVLITMSSIVPVVFLGYGYYPRFELVNVVIALVAFLFIYSFNFSIVGYKEKTMEL